ncbi:MAG: type II toxin-antitoxin system Phd/YefM family antitoxin [Proteobacteria bacterium]|nr:type II toxin-antitoxin system Phd/YefM family antitoxin [Pseudomonadota bacterium]
MPTLNATAARKDFFEMINSAVEKHEIFHIRHKKGDVVVMSQEEYDGLIETLHLQSTPGFKESLLRSVNQVKNGETFSFEEVFGEPQ